MADDPRVHRIVLTGGPCAGKSTSLARIRSFLENRGFYVCVIEEAATFLSRAGIYFTPLDKNLFQNTIVSTQINHENAMYQYALTMSKLIKRPAVMLMDRGLLDGSVYVTDEEYAACLATAGIDGGKEAVLKRYDLVLHLVTAALGAEKFYVNKDIDPDSPRHEEAAEAIRLDSSLQKAWGAHKDFFKFDNRGSFEDKLQAIIHRLCIILGVPLTSKKPKRYRLTAMPSEEQLTQVPGVVQYKYTKIYLEEPGQGRKPGEYSFIRLRLEEKTGKMALVMKEMIEEKGQWIEKKRVLNQSEFSNNLKFADPARHIVRQRRACFYYQGTYFEIVEYLKPHVGLLLLNVHPPESSSASSASSENKVVFPDFLQEVLDGDLTKDKKFSSHKLSLKNPLLSPPPVPQDEEKDIMWGLDEILPEKLNFEQDPSASQPPVVKDKSGGEAQNGHSPKKVKVDQVVQGQ